MIDWLTEPFRYQFMLNGLFAAVMVGITCATLGSYVVLRRMAFIGDALAHTTLPGLVVAYLQGWSLFGGAVMAGVATALGIELRGGTVRAEGDLDFRGTLGVDKTAPVGFKSIRLRFDLDTDADAEKMASLMKLTERYCVVYQTLRTPPAIEVTQRLTRMAAE